ncbi:hypothetical protein FRB97_003228 [Tulasnella sp. 331]|nr:hypothetical protein FRB97_003228 [Tulasnella sp. 331]
MRLLGLRTGDVFTKYDGLETRALNRLRRTGLNRRDAIQAMPHAAEQLFQEHWLDRIKTAHGQLPTYVRLRDLHKPDGDCAALTTCTAKVLEQNKPLQRMFVKAQHYALESRLSYAVPDLLRVEFFSVEQITERKSVSFYQHDDA